MKWLFAEDAALLGNEAASIATECRALVQMGIWPARHVRRFKLVNGSAAWVYAQDSGALTLLAVAPWDDRWTTDYVPAAVAYGPELPDHWITRPNSYVRSRTMKHRKATTFAHDTQWASGQALSGRAVILVRVAKVAQGKLVECQLRPEAPILPIGDITTVKAWFPLTKYPLGYERLWNQGEVAHGTIGWLGMRAAQQHKKAAKPPPEPKVAKRRGRPPKIRD
jgi:hypothetical protein